jgi:hypothetical protein
VMGTEIIMSKNYVLAFMISEPPIPEGPDPL